MKYPTVIEGIELKHDNYRQLIDLKAQMTDHYNHLMVDGVSRSFTENDITYFMCVYKANSLIALNFSQLNNSFTTSDFKLAMLGSICYNLHKVYEDLSDIFLNVLEQYD